MRTFVGQTAPPETIGESEAVIRSLYSITVDTAAGFDDQMGRLLQLGCERLGLGIGILARVEGEDYTVISAVAPQGVPVAAGDRFPLANTYCSVTLESDGPTSFEHADESPMRDHPAYRAFQLEAYLGTPVRVGPHVYGTLNFSSPTPRARAFRDVDIDALQLMAAWAGSELYRRQCEHDLHRSALNRAQTERTTLVGELIGAFRHELGSPLQSALANLGALGADAATDREIIEDIRHDLVRISDFTHELSRLAQHAEDRPVRIDLAAFLDRLLFDPLVRRGIETTMEHVWVEAPERSLYQALHNLLFAHLHGNAEPRPAHAVQVGCRARDGMAEVVVRSPCQRPAMSVRSDILSILRGEAPLSEMPLTLAAHVLRGIGGTLENADCDDGLITRVRLPLAAPVAVQH